MEVMQPRCFANYVSRGKCGNDKVGNAMKRQTFNRYLSGEFI